MPTIVIGTNRFVDCRNLLSVRGQPLLRIDTDPLRVTLTTPNDPPDGRIVSVEDNRVTASAPATSPRVIVRDDYVAIFLGEHALVQATLIERSPAVIHVRLDLRPLGINLSDDSTSLHVGRNRLEHNEVVGAENAINLL